MEEMIALKRHFQRERWIEVDMAWHEHIYEMSGSALSPRFFIRSTTPTSRRLRKMKW